jgi:hypothetical protein
MNKTGVVTAIGVFAVYVIAAPAPAPTGFPFTDENLNYSVNWPSGLSLGEVHMHAKQSGANWNFELSVDAGVPGYPVKDGYHAGAAPDFCSVSFDRATTHGTRITEEKETIDRSRGIATRMTVKGGGKTEIPVQDCVKDALTYLFYVRRELGQGRIPPTQQILFGALHQMRLEYAGAQMIPVNEQQTQSDKVICSFKGTSSEFKFEMYFARDAARTPLLIKAPLAMGTFSMELIR